MIDFKKLESATLKIAEKKISNKEFKDKIQAPRLGTGGHYDGIFLWDTAFTVMWAKYYHESLPVEVSLDNLYRLQDEEGFIHKEYTEHGEPQFPKYHPICFAPPILSWAEWDFYEYTKNIDRIKKSVSSFKKVSPLLSFKF